MSFDNSELSHDVFRCANDPDSLRCLEKWTTTGRFERRLSISDACAILSHFKNDYYRMSANKIMLVSLLRLEDIRRPSWDELLGCFKEDTSRLAALRQSLQALEPFGGIVFSCIYPLLTLFGDDTAKLLALSAFLKESNKVGAHTFMRCSVVKHIATSCMKENLHRMEVICELRNYIVDPEQWKIFEDMFVSTTMRDKLRSLFKDLDNNSQTSSSSSSSVNNNSDTYSPQGKSLRTTFISNPPFTVGPSAQGSDIPASSFPSTVDDFVFVTPLPRKNRSTILSKPLPHTSHYSTNSSSPNNNNNNNSYSFSPPTCDFSLQDSPLLDTDPTAGSLTTSISPHTTHIFQKCLLRTNELLFCVVCKYWIRFTVQDAPWLFNNPDWRKIARKHLVGQRHGSKLWNLMQQNLPSVVGNMTVETDNILLFPSPLALAEAAWLMLGENIAKDTVAEHVRMAQKSNYLHMLQLDAALAETEDAWDTAFVPADTVTLGVNPVLQYMYSQPPYSSPSPPHSSSSSRNDRFAKSQSSRTDTMPLHSTKPEVVDEDDVLLQIALAESMDDEQLRIQQNYAQDVSKSGENHKLSDIVATMDGQILEVEDLNEGDLC